MNIPPPVRRKFYTLRAVALVLMVFAGAIFILRPHNFAAQLLVALAILAGVLIVRYSNASVWRARGQVVGEWSPATTAKRVGRLAWTLTALSLIACGAFYFLMYLDQVHGGKVLWPVYAFFVAVLALTVTGSYVVFRIFR